MTRFWVAPSKVKDEDFYECAVEYDIVCRSPRREDYSAAEAYVEDHLCDLDYPEEIDIQVRTTGYRLDFTVHVRQVPEAEAVLKKPSVKPPDVVH